MSFGKTAYAFQRFRIGQDQAVDRRSLVQFGGSGLTLPIHAEPFEGFEQKAVGGALAPQGGAYEADAAGFMGPLQVGKENAGFARIQVAEIDAERIPGRLQPIRSDKAVQGEPVTRLDIQVRIPQARSPCLRIL